MNLIKIAKTCLVSLALAFGLNAADKAPPVESVAGKYSAIRNRIAEAKHAGRKVVLVLGAVPSERDHFQFNEASGFDREPYVVYLNDMALDWATYYPKAPHYAHNPVEAPAEWHDHFIQANFNYPQGFSGLFLNSFDLIISDYGTDHFMDFFKGHLKHFLSMLTDTGKMEFR